MEEAPSFFCSGMATAMLPASIPCRRSSNSRKAEDLDSESLSIALHSMSVAQPGTQAMMRKGSSAIKPGLARIQLLPAIEPSGYATREQLMEAVRNAIADALPAEMKPTVI